jgi:hypothetical protein
MNADQIQFCCAFICVASTLCRQHRPHHGGDGLGIFAAMLLQGQDNLFPALGGVVLVQFPLALDLLLVSRAVAWSVSCLGSTLFHLDAFAELDGALHPDFRPVHAKGFLPKNQDRTTTFPLPSIQVVLAALYTPAGILAPPMVNEFTVSVPLLPSGASVLILLRIVIVKLAAVSL